MKHHAPATLRNREFILEILKRVLPASGTTLEVASGSGEHAVYLAPQLAPRQWQPTDIDRDNLASIRAWMAETPSEQLYEPLRLDATASSWPVESHPPTTPINAVVCINMIHISRWEATLGLMAGVQRILPEGGVLYLYGPYQKDGRHTAPSNANFDQMLRAQDPSWGVRDLTAVCDLASHHGLEFSEEVAMPANNLSLVFRRKS